MQMEAGVGLCLSCCLGSHRTSQRLRCASILGILVIVQILQIMLYLVGSRNGNILTIVFGVCINSSVKACLLCTGLIQIPAVKLICKAVVLNIFCAGLGQRALTGSFVHTIAVYSCKVIKARVLNQELHSIDLRLVQNHIVVIVIGVGAIGHGRVVAVVSGICTGGNPNPHGRQGIALAILVCHTIHFQIGVTTGGTDNTAHRRITMIHGCRIRYIADGAHTQTKPVGVCVSGIRCLSGNQAIEVQSVCANLCLCLSRDSNVVVLSVCFSFVLPCEDNGRSPRLFAFHLEIAILLIIIIHAVFAGHDFPFAFSLGGLCQDNRLVNFNRYRLVRITLNLAYWCSLAADLSLIRKDIHGQHGHDHDKRHQTGDQFFYRSHHSALPPIICFLLPEAFPPRGGDYDLSPIRELPDCKQPVTFLR